MQRSGMLLVHSLLVLCVMPGTHHTISAFLLETTPKSDHEHIQDLLSEIVKLKKNMEALSRQVMLQQFFVEERIRSDGSSGLKQVRNNNDGTRAYYTADHAGISVGGIHEHASNIRTVGMGELNAVLNGVEFRTRHNDYRLRMPVTNDTTYDKMTNIQYPDVPPAVLVKHSVSEQVAEMKEWFKAFKNQDHSVRDYRKYFKPLLCYMEGGWTTETQAIQEPFYSDRHHLDASSWLDLQNKIRFTSYTGGKHSLENFAYLPTTIMNVVNGTPEYAQWNYRIACHPLKNDLPLSAFTLEDEVSQRMKQKLPMSKINETRLAHYSIRYRIPTTDRELNRYHDTSYMWGAVDDLMYEIPGKDNYGAFLTDESLGLEYHIHSTTDNMQKLNTAYYHRWYKVEGKDANGRKNVHRSFSDPNMFAAQTTSPKISGLSAKICTSVRIPHSRFYNETCKDFTERYTWAIPLEIIYMTPLLSWNPYNFTHTLGKGRHVYSVTHGPSGIRTGHPTPDRAFNGTHDRAFYRTPVEFFSSSDAVGVDKADTAKGVVGVLDRQGIMRKVVASGNRIIIPPIEGVGKIRTRYPIMPLHVDGEGTRKEVEALKDMVMRMPTYSSLFEEIPTTIANATALYNNEEHVLEVPPTTRDPPGLHHHDVVIHQYDIDDMKHNLTIKGVLTSIDNGHQHSLDIRLDGQGHYIMTSCDGMSRCWDGHDIHLAWVR